MLRPILLYETIPRKPSRYPSNLSDEAIPVFNLDNGIRKLSSMPLLQTPTPVEVAKSLFKILDGHIILRKISCLHLDTTGSSTTTHRDEAYWVESDAPLAEVSGSRSGRKGVV